jgi:hypothetical protein
MSVEDAKAFGLPEARGSRSHFVRLDGAKQNYAPLREAEWFEKCVYELGNGEIVPAPVPWTPPPAKEPSQHDLIALCGRIEQGGPSGEPWSPKLSPDARSVRRLLEEHGLAGSTNQHAILEQLRVDYGVETVNYKRSNRSRALGLRHEGKPPVTWIEERGTVG